MRLKMFNTETVNFLKMINNITNSVVLKYPITTGKTESADIAYMFDLSKFDTDGFENPIGFYNLSNFLNAFNLFEDGAEISLEDNVIKISDDTTSISYLTTSLDVLSQYEFKKEQFDKNDTFPTVLEMELTNENIRKLKNAHSVFSELDCALISCGETTELSLTQIGNFKKSSNSFKIIKDEVATKNFKIAIPLDTLSKLPQVTYTLKVKYNETKNAYRIILNTETFTLVINGKTVEE